MPFFTAAQQELEAINQVLSSIRRPSLAALPSEGTGPQDVQFAREELYRTTRDLQAEGWVFNTTSAETLAPVAGEIAVDADVVTVRVLDDGVLAVLRDGKLWDPTKNAVDQWAGSLTADVVRLLPWDSLPVTFRRYVIARTATTVYRSLVGTDSHLDILLGREDQARSVFRADDIRLTRGHSADTYIGQRIYGRLRPWRPPI